MDSYANILIGALKCLKFQYEINLFEWSLVFNNKRVSEYNNIVSSPGGGGTQVKRGIGDVPRNRVPFSPLW